MLILPFDTETTGLPSKKLPLNHPSQPHLVSCSALQVNLNACRIQQSMSKMVSPQGWEWDDSPQSTDSAFKVHLLMVDDCKNYGRSEKEVLDELLHLWYCDGTSAELVAHNLEFDRDIIAIAIARYYPGEANLLNTWLESSGTCTMKTNKELVDARTVKGARKNPNLKETYKFFLGEELERHHSANADCAAVYQIYMAMQEMAAA